MLTANQHSTTLQGTVKRPVGDSFICVFLKDLYSQEAHMKHTKLRRIEVINSIIEQTGGQELRTSRVDKVDDRVSRAMWAGNNKLVIVLEQARKVVGYNLFSRSQLKRARKYSKAFLEEQRVLWQRSES